MSVGVWVFVAVGVLVEVFVAGAVGVSVGNALMITVPLISEPSAEPLSP